MLPKLPNVRMIFADPPDNLGVKYEGFEDKLWQPDYDRWLFSVMTMATKTSDICWVSHHSKYNRLVQSWLPLLNYQERKYRAFIWRFTFGQHNNNDCGYGYRPLLRIMKPDTKLYPDAIRVPSKRQTVYNDKRANPAGRVPDDVWEFPRVCGTFKERRKWHPNQHPEDLIERMVKFSCKPGDHVIDLFAGTGTTLRVCKRLGIDCTGIEISKYYCEKIVEELNTPLFSSAEA